MVVSTTRVATRVRLISRGEADALAKPLGKGGTISELGGVQPQAGKPHRADISPFFFPKGGSPPQTPPGGPFANEPKKKEKLLVRTFWEGKKKRPIQNPTFVPPPPP